MSDDMVPPNADESVAEEQDVVDSPPANDGVDNTPSDSNTGDVAVDLSGVAPEERAHINPTNIPAVDPGTPNPAEDNPIKFVPNTGLLPTVSKTATALVHAGEPKLAEVDFVLASRLDQNRRVDRTGTYLDDVERANAEVKRAQVEGREPDLANPSTTTSDQVLLTTVAQTMIPNDAVLKPSFSQEIMVGLSEEDRLSEQAQIDAARERYRLKLANEQ